jgi:hypothetical protein
MRFSEWRRWFQRTPRSLYIGAVIVLLGIVMVQGVKNSRLNADVARFQEGQTALLRERADLKWRADAFEKEVVDWRHKNGENGEHDQLSPDNQFHERPQAPPVR